jgi:hypothetical protein
MEHYVLIDELAVTDEVFAAMNGTGKNEFR